MRRLAGVCLGICSAVMANGFVVDDFTTGDYHDVTTTSYVDTSMAASVPGGIRRLVYGIDHASSGSAITVDISGGAFSITNTPDMTSSFILGYGDSADLNANLLAEGNMFQVTVAYNEGTMPFSTYLHSSTYGTLPTSLVYLPQSATPYMFDIPFSSFGVAMEDFTDIDSIEFQGQNQPEGASYSFGSILVAAPEPASFSVLGLAVGLLIKRTRKRNRNLMVF